ncbi:A24 family peptidase [Bryobacter aggregatus]|uniref:A24 family peptidase n=1 Tax=Bryobacter aggregatus TaxID=360054 RepID=UPI00068A4628|nr:A24 family peptidase [Bryobacter aggregatus]
MTLETAVALSVGLAASGEDLWRRNISNGIPLAALVGALVVQTNRSGWHGLGQWALGAICGFCVFLIFFILGGMGGGDVKLMAGFGALLGPSRLVEAALLTAGIGGILAMILVLSREALRAWRGRHLSDKAQVPPIDNYIPYAPAITLGSWLALIPKGV